jgi:hypothetical protein
MKVSLKTGLVALVAIGVVTKFADAMVPNPPLPRIVYAKQTCGGLQGLSLKTQEVDTLSAEGRHDIKAASEVYPCLANLVFAMNDATDQLNNKKLSELFGVSSVRITAHHSASMANYLRSQLPAGTVSENCSPREIRPNGTTFEIEGLDESGARVDSISVSLSPEQETACELDKNAIVKLVKESESELKRKGEVRQATLSRMKKYNLAEMLNTKFAPKASQRL